MKIEVKHSGEVRGGVKYYDNPDIYRQQLQELEGKRFIEIIKEKHKKLTRSQQNYYRGGILPACHKSEHFYHFDKTEDIHEDYFSEKFLTYKKEVKIDNERYLIKKKISTASLNQKEMAEFIERVIAHCGELGIEVPDNTQYYNKYFK